VQRDWIREKSGRRVKARPNSRSLKQPAAPAAASSAASTATDPATFAVQNLVRLAALVAAAAAAEGVPDDALVVVKDGNLVVAGAGRGRLEA